MDVVTEVYRFYRGYGGEKGNFGFSEEGLPLVYMKAGAGRPVLLAQYAMHAREYVTAYVALKQIALLENKPPEGTVYVLPLVNPDGVKKCLAGAPLWKANARGVDLNVNFDARWGTGVQNKRFPGPSDYIGEAPFSAAESAALRDFTLRVAPDMTLSYHTKGEVIYWYFYQDGARLPRDRSLAETAARETGYALAEAYGSAGGYKDWCVEKLKIPALTLETGAEELSHPVGREHAEEIARRSEGVFAALLNALRKKTEKI